MNFNLFSRLSLTHRLQTYILCSTYTHETVAAYVLYVAVSAVELCTCMQYSIEASVVFLLCQLLSQ